MFERTEAAPSRAFRRHSGPPSVRVILCGAALLITACRRSTEPLAPGGTPASSKPDTQVTALIQRARQLRDARSIDLAIESLEQAVRIDSACVEAWSELAAFALEKGDERRARAAAMEAVQREPEAALPHGVIGALGIRQGNFEEAVAHLEKVSKLRPRPDDLEALGRAYAGLGRFEDAARVFQAALRLDPRHTGSLNDLGLIELREERLDAARRCFEAVLAIDPEDERALFNLGNTLMRLGEHAKGREALAAFQARKRVLVDVDVSESAARSQPLSPDAHCDLAEAYARAARIEASVGSFVRALQLDPAHKRSLRGITRLGIEQGNTEPVRELLEAGLAKSQGDPEITALLGELQRSGSSTGAQGAKP
jgi:tetratricopeptide (TPR) repeat protein